MSAAPRFIGRISEMKRLNKLLKKRTASLVVIKGRRRIGKSRLIEEFAKQHTHYTFSGLAPTEHTSAQSQRDEFSRQLNAQLSIPEMQADDWSKLFLLLADKLIQGQIILSFDEISWMGSKDPDFLGKLKNFWDIYLKKNPKLVFILCGSTSSWIQKNILSSTGFLGRVSLRMTLKELPLNECKEFWPNSNISAYEKLKILAVTGGIPRYLEEIDSKETAENNIKDLCFTSSGILVDEFNDIFNDLFSSRSDCFD